MEQAVELKNADGQFILGLCCEIVKVDYENAVRVQQIKTLWQRNVQLAIYYYHGKGVVANSAKAIELLQKAGWSHPVIMQS